VRFLISRTRDDEDDEDDEDAPFPPRRLEISSPNVAWFLPFLQKLVPLYGSLRAGTHPPGSRIQCPRCIRAGGARR